jgi:hypothetical protein
VNTDSLLVGRHLAPLLLNPGQYIRCTDVGVLLAQLRAQIILEENIGRRGALGRVWIPCLPTGASFLISAFDILLFCPVAFASCVYRRLCRICAKGILREHLRKLVSNVRAMAHLLRDGVYARDELEGKNVERK